MNKKINKKIILTLNCYFIYLLLGFSKNILGPVLPSLIDNYKISLTIAGVLFTFLSTGRFFAVATSTVVIDTIGRKPILVTGNILVTVGLFGYAISTFWWGHLISVLLIGLGIGFAIPGCNALIADLYQEKRGKALNLLHMCFSIGAFLGPMITGYYLSLDFSWRWVYLTGAIFSSIILISLLKLQVPGRKNYKKMMKQDLQKNYLVLKERLIKLSHTPIFYLLALVMLIYIGVGNSIIGWVNKYLGDTLSFSVFAASGVLALFNVGRISGRLGVSFVTDSLGYKRTILFSAIGTLIFINVAVLSNNTFLIFAGFALSGFFMASLNPTAIAYATKLFPEMIGTVSSALACLAAVGGITIPWVVGFVSDHFGLKGGMMIPIIFAVILVITAFYITDDREQLNDDTGVNI